MPVPHQIDAYTLSDVLSEYVFILHAESTSV
jgi:hypothetical protein